MAQLLAIWWQSLKGELEMRPGFLVNDLRGPSTAGQGCLKWCVQTKRPFVHPEWFWDFSDAAGVIPALLAPGTALPRQSMGATAQVPLYLSVLAPGAMLWRLLLLPKLPPQHFSAFHTADVRDTQDTLISNPTDGQIINSPTVLSTSFSGASSVALGAIIILF